MNLKDLAKPFPESDIEWRIGQSGTGKKGPWAKVLAYVNARAIMDRLDSVCGPENWQVKYRTESGEGMESGIVASIGIRIGEEWVWKEDGADQTDIEKFKGGISGALKRAGVPWGIGRYLYKLEATFADVKAQDPGGYYYAKTKDGVFFWKPPALPQWALPEEERRNRPAAKGPAPDAKPKTVSPPASGVDDAVIAKMTRPQLNTAVAKMQKELGLSDQDLVAWIKEDFNKSPRQMSDDEIRLFLQTLQRESALQGV